MVRSIGSREEVWNKKAIRTPGGLKKSDLMINPRTGKITSKKASEAAKKRYKTNLKKGVGLCGPCIRKFLKGEIKINKSYVPKKNKKILKPKTSPRKTKVVGPKNEKRLKEIEKELGVLQRTLDLESTKSRGVVTKKVSGILNKLKETRKMKTEVQKAIVARRIAKNKKKKSKK